MKIASRQRFGSRLFVCSPPLESILVVASTSMKGSELKVCRSSGLNTPERTPNRQAMDVERLHR